MCKRKVKGNLRMILCRYAVSDCIEDTKIKETYLAVIDVASESIQRQLEDTRIC